MTILKCHIPAVLQHLNEILRYVIKSVLRSKGLQEVLLTIFPRSRFKTLIVSSDLTSLQACLFLKIRVFFLFRKVLSLAKVIGGNKQFMT